MVASWLRDMSRLVMASLVAIARARTAMLSNLIV